MRWIAIGFVCLLALLVVDLAAPANAAEASRWEVATLIETDDAGEARVPQVAVDPDGNAFAVWRQDDGTRTNIWANRFVPGSGWGTATLIESEDLGDASVPQVAVDPDGNAVAVWQQDNGTGASIWANRFVPGSGWGTATLIESGTNDAFSPQVAVDPNGNAVAVWEQTNDTQFSIWANRFVPGSGWGTATLIEMEDTGGAYDAQVAVDSDGHAIAVWLQQNGTHIDVRANRFVPGSGWGTSALIEMDDAGHATFPHVAVDPDGNAVAVWDQDNGTLNSIWSNRYVPGSGWGTAMLIEMEDVNHAYAPEVAVDPDGRAVAVWHQDDGSRTDIWANRFVPGSGWGTPTLVETDDTDDASDPDVTLDPDGNAIAVWDQSDGTRIDIWANRFVPGTGWGAATRIETHNMGNAAFPRVAVDPLGNAVAVWPQEDGTRTDIWANRFVRDDVPPELAITSPTFSLTNDASVTVAGTTEAGATVTVNTTPVAVDGMGDFSLTVTLPDGTHVFDVAARDVEGNVNAVQLTVTVDTTPPYLSLTAPTEGTVTATPALTVAGTTDADAQLAVNSIPVEVASDGSFSVVLSLAEGLNVVHVVARDAAGNVAERVANVTFANPVPGLEQDLQDAQEELADAEENLQEATDNLAALNLRILILQVLLGVFAALSVILLLLSRGVRERLK